MYIRGRFPKPFLAPRILSQAASTKVIHFSGKEMDSKAVAVTAPANSLEAFLTLLVKQGERESTGGSDLTMH
jgi:hypothetical protein